MKRVGVYCACAMQNSDADTWSSPAPEDTWEEDTQHSQAAPEDPRPTASSVAEQEALQDKLRVRVRAEALFSELRRQGKVLGPVGGLRLVTHRQLGLVTIQAMDAQPDEASSSQVSGQPDDAQPDEQPEIRGSVGQWVAVQVSRSRSPRRDSSLKRLGRAFFC